MDYSTVSNPCLSLTLMISSFMCSVLLRESSWVVWLLLSSWFSFSLLRARHSSSCTTCSSTAKSRPESVLDPKPKLSCLRSSWSLDVWSVITSLSLPAESYKESVVIKLIYTWQVCDITWGTGVSADFLCCTWIYWSLALMVRSRSWTCSWCFWACCVLSASTSWKRRSLSWRRTFSSSRVLDGADWFWASREQRRSYGGGRNVNTGRK